MHAIAEPMIVRRPSGGLVFGMHWFPLVGGEPANAGRRLARLHRSTHMVLPDGTLGAIGIVALKARLPRGTRLYSAAQNIAQLYATGTIAVLLELDGIGYWLIAVHEGAVVAGTDVIYSVAKEADEAIASLRQAYPQLQVMMAPHTSRLTTLDDLDAASSSRTLLRPIKRWQSVLPRPIQYFVLALLLVALAPRLWHVFEHDSTRAAAQAPPDPAQAWRMAVAQSGRHRVVHGIQGTRALLDAFHGLPVGVGGWLLHQADCHAEPNDWQCRAHYRRQAAQATNKSFMTAMPAAWKVEFSSLDHVVSHWRVQAYGSPLTQLTPPVTHEVDRYLASALQDISAGFAQIRLGRPVPVAMSAPVDEQGLVLARPAGQGVYLSRPAHIVGPLRSASLLLPHVAIGAWEKATLTLSPSDRPSLKHSRLNLSLQGVFYETDLSMAGMPAVRCTQSRVGQCG